MSEGFHVRRARTSDVAAIEHLFEPFVQSRIMLGKDRVVLFETVQEFRVAESDAGEIIGCGALHVVWEDLAEVRTLAVLPEWKGRGVGHAILLALEEQARELGVQRLFCLSFEVDFFGRHGFVEIGDDLIPAEVYAEIVRSPDEGIAEMLELARVKPNTLGNTRMLKTLG